MTDNDDPTPQIGPLIRVAEALDSLFEMTLPLGSLELDDRVTIFNRIRALGFVVLVHMTEEQSATIQQILHPDFFDPTKRFDTTISARASLAILRGYVHGCISELSFEAQLNANADAYAKEKVKAERGVGFRATRGSEGTTPRSDN